MSTQHIQTLIVVGFVAFLGVCNFAATCCAVEFIAKKINLVGDKMTEQQQALDAGLSQLKTAITDATLRITNKLDAAKAAALVAGVDLTTEIGDVQSDINILHSIGSEPSAPPAVVPSDSVIVTPTAPVETPEAAPMPTDVSGFSSTLDA